MNLPRLLCAFIGLGVGFIFYLAHRSDYTLSNRLLASICAPSTYLELKHAARIWLPVPHALCGCLPSALWCWIVSGLMGGWRIRAGHHLALPLAGLCPLINASWEMIQSLGWTDGRGDALDIAAGFLGWAVARVTLLRSAPAVEISARCSWRVGVVVSGFACMGLADVWR